jgi:hypothetical protein
MSKTKHTPDWTYAAGVMGGEYTVWDSGLGNARVLGKHLTEEEARLIASAPELLSALEKALHWADKDCLEACANEVQKARAAIAKAKGES